MSRSIWKGPFQEKKIFLKINKKHKRIQIWSRSSVISSFFINKTIFINTGKGFRKVFITRDHIGFKFGEFAPTRAFKKISKQLKKPKGQKKMLKK